LPPFPGDHAWGRGPWREENNDMRNGRSHGWKKETKKRIRWTRVSNRGRDADDWLGSVGRGVRSAPEGSGREDSVYMFY
jgi:hypothetical protein